jgi:hypothetical protein
MRKYRLISLLLAAALFLAPTVILVVRAASVGRFPDKDEVSAIEISTSQDVAGTVIEADHPLFATFFEMLDECDRIAASDLPKDSKVFYVGMRLADITEKLRFYISSDDYSFYVRNSENRYFAFRAPEIDIFDTILKPSKVELCMRGENIPLVSYPNQSVDRDELTYKNIQLSRWEKLEEIVSTREAESTLFKLYKQQGDGSYALIDEASDVESLISASPDGVLYSVRWELFEEVDLIHYYWFSLGNG